MIHHGHQRTPFGVRSRAIVAILLRPRLVHTTAARAEVAGTTRPEGWEQAQPWLILVPQADDQFLETFELTLLAGRNFERDGYLKSPREYLINETAAKQLGWYHEAAPHACGTRPTQGLARSRGTADHEPSLRSANPRRRKTDTGCANDPGPRRYRLRRRHSAGPHFLKQDAKV